MTKDSKIIVFSDNVLMHDIAARIARRLESIPPNKIRVSDSLVSVGELHDVLSTIIEIDATQLEFCDGGLNELRTFLVAVTELEEFQRVHTQFRAKVQGTRIQLMVQSIHLID